MPSRPVIRRIERERSPSFDEQLWPVNLAILVLAGFVEGIIIARLPFVDPPNLLQNGWTWTVTVAATLLVGLWFVARIDNQRLRRRAQLATVLSLFLHALIFVAVNHEYLLPLPAEETAHEVAQEFTPPVVLQEYDAATFREAQQPDFERPVPTQTPDWPAEVSPPPRPQPKPVESAIPSPPVAQPVRPPVQPKLTDARRPSQDPARRGEIGRSSRNPAIVTAPAAGAARAPEQRETAQAAPAEIDARLPATRAAAASPLAPRHDATHPPATTAQPSDVQTPRRTSDQRQLVQSSPSAPRRPVADRTAEPVRVESPTGDVAGTPRQTQPDQLTPRQVGERRLATSPEVGSSVQPPSTAHEAIEPRAESPAREIGASEPSSSAVTRSDRGPAVRRSPSDVAAAQATAVAPESSPSAARAVASRAVAANGAPTRGSSSGTSTSASPSSVPQARATIAATTDRSSGAGENPADRAQASMSASQAPRHGTAARSSEQSAAAPSTALADSPRAAFPTPTPGSSAPTRSFQGLTGAGRSQNFDQGPAAARNPATVASAAARRPMATMQDASATGLTAGLPATIPRRRAGATIPTATNPVEASQGALAGASDAPRREIDADASAALVQGAARAPLARETADAGPADIDTGSTRVVSETGQGRPAGGGQLTIGEVNLSQFVSRRRAGGQGATATAPAEAAVAQSAADNGAAGGATAPQVGARDAAIARSTAGESTGATEARAATGPVPSDNAIVAVTTSGGRRSEENGGEVGVTASSAPGARRAAAASSVAAIPGDVPTSPGEVASAGTPAGIGVDARGTQEVRTTASEPPGLSRRSAGVNPAAHVATSGSVAGAARRSSDAGFDAQGASASVAGGPRRRAPEIGAISGTASVADIPGTGAAPPAEVAPSADSVAGDQTGVSGRRDGGPQSVSAGPEGPSGLDPNPTTAPTTSDRPRETLPVANINPITSRQPRRTPATSPSVVETTARLPSEFFGDRKGRRYLDAPAASPPGSVAKTEHAIESGLEFLARRQFNDGRWSLHEYPGRPQGEAPSARAIHSDTAATGLALLAFLGAAYDHYGDRYQHSVGQGVKWLVSRQAADGNLYVSHDRRSDESAIIYSHAIATIALCEAYGMTGDSSLREPAQKAIDFLVRTQHPDHGGWRYATAPGVKGYSSDTSVTGWAVMALKSGELAKLKVPKGAYQGVMKWLDYAQGGDAEGSRYKYNPNAALDPSLQRNLAHAVTPTMTSVGLLSRLYIGWNREHRSMIAGAKYLTAYPPDISANQLRDTYYWYYATQVMFHMGGDFWQKWQERLHPLLIDTQLRQGPLAGSWDPQHDVWGAAAGRIYVTTMNLLSLEVYYRHLPLYEDTAR